MNTNRTRAILLCGLFAALCAVGAFIRIPVPVCPFTLQYLFTMLAGALLGAKRGAVSVGIYVLAGLIGLPVFAEGGGLWYVLKPTFGYLPGFIAGAYVTGKILRSSPAPSAKRMLAANISGLMVVYAAGMIYYYLISNLYLGEGIGVWTLFLYCFLLAVPGDIALCVLGMLLEKRLLPITAKYVI